MESSNGMNAGQDTMSNPVLTPSPAPSNPSSPSESVNEKLVRQSEVNDLIGRAKREAYEKGRNSVTPTQTQSNYSDSAPTQTMQSAPYQQSVSSEDHIRRIAAEEAARTRDQIYADAQAQSAKSQWDRVTQTYEAKISAGKEKYPDFDTVANIDMSGYPAVKQILADYVDNSADLLYELGKDRFKLSQLEAMGRDQYQWRDAIVQAQRISSSIKENEKAAKVRLPNEPLSQLRPSITGMDSGNVSHRDLRMKYRA